MSSVSIASLIDQSDSMRSFGYMEPAKTDAATFITIMKEADQIGVVAFSTESRVIYPLKTIHSDHKTINEAINEIKKLSPIYLTNIEQAISQGHQMLNATGNANRAMILLSDGLWTAGGNPLRGLPSDIPIYTIALGDRGQCSILQELARKTNGQYHFSPDAFELAEIYNQIADDASVATTAINQKQQIDSYRFTTLPLYVPEGSDHVSLAVNWLDESVIYTTGSPGVNQVNILLRDPDGQKIVMPPTFIGNGFVTFHLHDPKPGQWTTGCWCGNMSQNIFRGTVGAFEPNSTIKLNCKLANTDMNCGDQLDLKTILESSKNEIGNIIIKTTIESPVDSKETILEKYKDEIKNTEPDEELMKKGVNEVDAKLNTLHKKLLPHVNIFARRQSPVYAKYSKDGVEHEPIKLDISGNHTIRVDVEGTILSSNTKFTRTRRLSVNVK
ncbi:vWA domain-containing protein [Vallitalea sp.]|uniref:vWA domain-containing protein n=1 Tax=Vallitalea sp. TaxID=1882829 RepID=UPI0025F975E4|nr:vWA domain-containing protein [Vallitalea sp.]MCT4687760.1 VWA domain-containing protein [Vallitalea sp.]